MVIPPAAVCPARAGLRAFGGRTDSHADPYAIAISCCAAYRVSYQRSHRCADTDGCSHAPGVTYNADRAAHSYRLARANRASSDLLAE